MVGVVWFWVFFCEFCVGLFVMVGRFCWVYSCHRLGYIELSFLFTSDATVSLEGVPSGTTLSLLARGTDPKYGPRTASEEDEGVLKWYFSEEEVQEFYDEGVLFVYFRSRSEERRVGL